MSMKRFLTSAEKKHIHDVKMAEERLAYPDHHITVIIKDETDDEGEPQVHVLKQREIELPPGWNP